MKIYTDKQGISHEETMEFDPNNPKDVAAKKWFDRGLMSSNEVETVKNKVCCGCGGKLDYIDTVDNSGNPTKWLGCNHCSRFTSGVTKEQFSIARELVNTQISVPYRYNVVSDDRADWLEVQTHGNSRLAHYITEKIDQAILNTKQEMVEEFIQLVKLFPPHGGGYRCQADDGAWVTRKNISQYDLLRDLEKRLLQHSPLKEEVEE